MSATPLHPVRSASSMLTRARRLGEPGDRSHGAAMAVVAVSVGFPVGEGVTGGGVDLDSPAERTD
jgi:hypothetical protein